MKRFFYQTVIGLTLAGAGLFAMAPNVWAIPHPEDPYGLKTTASRTPYSDPATSQKTLPELIGGFIGVLLSLVGLVFLVLSVYGGFKWMTAAGDEDSVKEGRDTLVNAAIGIALIMCAYALTTFLFDSAISVVSTTTPPAPPASQQPTP